MENSEEIRRIGDEFAAEHGLGVETSAEERSKILLMSMSMHAGVFTLKSTIEDLEAGRPVDPDKVKILGSWSDMIAKIADAYAEEVHRKKS